MKHVSKPFTHATSHLKIEIMREFGLKIGNFNAHNILVAPQCKILAIALQEYFKTKFGTFLVINSILNEVFMVNFDHGVICELKNPHNVL